MREHVTSLCNFFSRSVRESASRIQVAEMGSIWLPSIKRSQIDVLELVSEQIELIDGVSARRCPSSELLVCRSSELLVSGDSFRLIRLVDSLGSLDAESEEFHVSHEACGASVYEGVSPSCGICSVMWLQSLAALSPRKSVP